MFCYSITLWETQLKRDGTGAAIRRCYVKKVLWKYAANLQENTHAEVRFQ